MRDTTDITLFVRTSGEEVVEWDRRRITDALIREAGLSRESAEEISREVEKQIFSSGISTLTASLVRELVNARLIGRGLEKERRLHARLGFPLYDIRELMTHSNRENANVPHWPEGTNLVLAEGIKRDFALNNVFSAPVADAHISGDLHVHDLGYIDRPYGVFLSLEYVKKFGLDLPDWFSVAAPARHAEVLLAHMVRFSAALQGNYGGWVRWDAVNLLFAPYLTDLNDKSVKQLAQMLVFEFSQLATARGGQLMFTSMDLYWEVPPHLFEAGAIGPGGRETGGKYSDYLEEARRFASALIEVFRDGDARGRPFFFPIPLVHVTESMFQPENSRFLAAAAEAASRMGNPHFIFDRKGSFRLPLAENSPKNAGDGPVWGLRRHVVQNVTLNLARLGYLARQDDAKLFALLEANLGTAVRAHLEKREFLEKLLAEPQGPLSFLATGRDGAPLLDLPSAVYVTGFIGLYELGVIHGNHPPGREGRSRDFCYQVVKFIEKRLRDLSRDHGIRVIAGQAPSEIASYKFARLDLKRFSPLSGRTVSGDIASGGVYYSDSVSLPFLQGISLLERVRAEGFLHPFVEGVCSRLPLNGDTPGEVQEIIRSAFFETGSLQLTFSPVFTSCAACRKTFSGNFPSCPDCGGADIEKISKVTGYFARSSSLNQAKLAELELTFRPKP